MSGIIPTEINITGKCKNNICETGRILNIHGKFKNTDHKTRTNTIGAKVNNVKFNEKIITLDPNEEYTYTCSLFLLNDSYYDVCLFAE